jgi:mono/diheme cytochrome c family protein
MLNRRTLKTMFLTAVLTPAVTVATALAAGGRDATVARGQEVTPRKVPACHAVAGKGNKTNPLDGIGAKLSAADIKEWILHPTEMTAKAKSTKKPPMPAKYAALPAADVDALVAYLQSLK